jgi:hypothetical protein
MQFRGLGKPPLGIVFDCDMGESIDTALALAMLYGFQGKNEARVISISTSKPNLKAAAFCDTVARFYSGEPGPFTPPLSIGMADSGPAPGDTPMLLAMAAKFPARIQKPNETADPVTLIRNALTAQYDQNASVVLAGPATNLARLLDLPGAKELIAKKVKLLAIAEARVDRDPAAAKRLTADWPTPVVTAGAELGEALPFPGACIEKDFAWSTAPHPIVEAYRAYQPMPYDAPSWAMAAALYAAKSQEKFFEIAKGRLALDPAQTPEHQAKDRVIQVYTEMASAKPVPRTRGRRG